MVSYGLQEIQAIDNAMKRNKFGQGASSFSLGVIFIFAAWQNFDTTS